MSIDARVLWNCDEYFEIEVFKRCLKCNLETNETNWTIIDGHSKTYINGYGCKCNNCKTTTEHYADIKYTGRMQLRYYK